MAVPLSQRIPSPLRMCGLRRFRRKAFVFVITVITYSLVTFAFEKFQLYRTGYSLMVGDKPVNLPAVRDITLNDSTVNPVKGSLIEEVTSWKKEVLPAWHQYSSDFSVMELYHPNSSYLSRLLHELAVVEIRNTSIYRRGSQFKFLIEFVDGNKAVSKPMRSEREFYFHYRRWGSYLSDMERHTAEIAAYHLDRIFDFRKVPPCIGRVLNFTGDIIQKTNDSDILNTQRTKDGQKCIIGGCRKDFCSEKRLTCAKGEFLEVSLCQKIPESIKVKQVPYPWSPDTQKTWNHTNICKNVTEDEVVRKNDLFLYFMEIAVFDHLMLNYDRHHFKTIYVNRAKEIGFALFDNGKGFGNPYKDDISLLAPITQCCRFRRSLYQKVLTLTSEGNKLSSRMRASLSRDPLDPVLTDAFYPALDRRLAQVLSEMTKCLEKFEESKVFSEKW